MLHLESTAESRPICCTMPWSFEISFTFEDPELDLLGGEHYHPDPTPGLANEMTPEVLLRTLAPKREEKVAEGLPSWN